MYVCHVHVNLSTPGSQRQLITPSPIPVQELPGGCEQSYKCVMGWVGTGGVGEWGLDR